jgi:SAM-dependent methyltransferase
LTQYYKTEYRGNRHGFTSEHCVRRRLRWVHKVVGQQKRMKLLDIGCGEGTFLSAARQAGHEVAGTELEPAAARAQDLRVAGSLSELAHEVATYDCITFWHSLEHMPNPVESLQQAVSLLKPGGILLVAVPDAGGWQARVFGDAWLHLDIPRHLYHFNKTSLERLLQGAGLKVISFWHQEFEYDLLGWSQSTLNKTFRSKNVFFDVLRGKAEGHSFLKKTIHSIAGMVTGALAVPLVPVGAACGQGGTLVVAAAKS